MHILAEGNGYFFPHEINEFYWGSVAFLVVLGLIIWKGGRPVKGFMSRYSEGIASELDEAASVRAAAEAETAQLLGQIGDPGAESARILAEARATAEQVREDLLAKADADAAALRERTVAELHASRAHVSGDLESEVGSLTFGAAERVVANELDTETQIQLIEDYINEVGS